MNNTLKDTVKIIDSYMDKNLISSDNFTHIYNIANLLPNIPLTSNIGFECYLDDNTKRTDFFASFDVSNINKILDNKHISFIEKPATPIDNIIGRFLNRCIDSKYSLRKNIENIWFEYDCGFEQHQKIPQPSIFFATDYDEENNSTTAVVSADNWISDEAIELLLGNSLSKQIKQRLLTCFQCLPEKAKIFQIGIMLPRKNESETIRLCVEGLKKDQTQKYLEDVGYSKNDCRLSSILLELSDLVDVIKLNFAIDKKNILPKIGFECCIAEQPNNSHRWNTFFDYLIKNKLCSFEKAEAILSWSGYIEKDSYEALCPESILNAATLVEDKYKSTIVRLVHHVKVVYEPGNSLQAKAYLWFGHRWLSSDGKFRK